MLASMLANRSWSANLQKRRLIRHLRQDHFCLRLCQEAEALPKVEKHSEELYSDSFSHCLLS